MGILIISPTTYFFIIVFVYLLFDAFRRFESRQLHVRTSPDRSAFDHGTHAYPDGFFAANKIKILPFHIAEVWVQILGQREDLDTQTTGRDLNKEKIWIHRQQEEIGLDLLKRLIYKSAMLLSFDFYSLWHTRNLEMITAYIGGFGSPMTFRVQQRIQSHQNVASITNIACHFSPIMSETYYPIKPCSWIAGGIRCKKMLDLLLYLIQVFYNDWCDIYVYDRLRLNQKLLLVSTFVLPTFTATCFK